MFKTSLRRKSKDHKYRIINNYKIKTKKKRSQNDPIKRESFRVKAKVTQQKKKDNSKKKKIN